MSESVEAKPAVPGTAAGCVEFLDAAGEKGWIPEATAKALRTAFVKCMEIDDEWEAVDLRSLDLDEQFDRFRTLRRNVYSDGSLRVYRSRVTQATQMYLARIADDPNWKSYGPSGRATSGKSKAKTKPEKAPEKPEVDGAAPPRQEPMPPLAPSEPLAPASKVITHVFPLRADLDVQLVLPRDLTKGEAEWLGKLLSTLPRPTIN